MEKDLFGEVVRPSAKLGPRAWYTLPLSVIAHVAIAALVVVVPLMATDTLPAPAEIMRVLVPSSEEPTPPPPPPAPASDSRPSPQAVETNPRAVATEPAAGIVEESPPPPLPGVPGGTAEGIPAGIPGGTGPVTVAPPPPPPAVSTEPRRPGGQIKRPVKIRDVRPPYPQIAVANRVEGLVMIDAIIGTDGKVKEARVIKSIPLLDRAALDAVLQWQFTPTLLNGVPVPIIMTVTVNFTLRNNQP